MWTNNNKPCPRCRKKRIEHGKCRFCGFNSRMKDKNAELLAALKSCCEEAMGFDVPRCYACRVADGHCVTMEYCKVWKAIQKAE